ncbi:MAG: hypothetical protein CMB80_05670 [Flammeovirgaceae bacterium]|nr:hypothetical protein [Flammeovirgaceae bacterium]|tara:strand:+ start:1528 stop:2556 length:1029 start_codon:yes stop_codon:yes gene_type:complete
MKSNWRYRLNKRWTAREDALVERFFGYVRAKDFSHLLPRRTTAAIQKRARILNVPSTRPLHKGHRTYHQNDYFFSTPNQMNSYYAGFICADGHLSSADGVHMCLNKKDFTHLCEMAKDTGYNGKVSTYTMDDGSERTMLRVYSARQWVLDLHRNWNITPQKTVGQKAPFIKDDELIKAFLVGLIDGDGSIGTINRASDKRQEHFVEFLGTRSLMLWVKRWVDKAIPPTRRNTPMVHRKRGGNDPEHLHRFGIYGNRAEALIKLLADVPIPRLERKWRRFMPVPLNYTISVPIMQRTVFPDGRVEERKWQDMDSVVGDLGAVSREAIAAQVTSLPFASLSNPD